MFRKFCFAFLTWSPVRSTCGVDHDTCMYPCDVATADKLPRASDSDHEHPSISNLKHLSSFPTQRRPEIRIVGFTLYNLSKEMLLKIKFDAFCRIILCHTGWNFNSDKSSSDKVLEFVNLNLVYLILFVIKIEMRLVFIAATILPISAIHTDIHRQTYVTDRRHSIFCCCLITTK